MKKAFAVAALVAFSTPALAGPEEDNIRYIEDYLNRIKDKLDGIVGDSSSSDIDSALEHLGYVKDYTDKLKSLAPQNDPGKSMVYYYPDYISKFRESAKYLKQMKDAQVKADESRLSERCIEADRNLKYFLQGFVEKKDPNGLYKIPDEAEKIGRTYGDELRKMQEVHNEMDRWRGYARNFSDSHGKWSDVKGELHDGVSDIWDRWTRRMEETKYKCLELAKGKDYEPVKEAMSKLGGFGQARIAIRKKIDEKLQAAAYKLKDLDSRSGDGASEIQDAQRSMDEALGLLSDLKDIQGDDRDSREIADRWPSQARSAKESIDSYKKLKAGQDFLDAHEKECSKELEDLKRFLAEKTGADNKKNPQKAVADIHAKSAELQKKWQAKKDDADKFGRDMASWKEKAASFSFRDGEWSRLYDALQGSAGKSLTYYNVKRAKIYDSEPCSQLQLGYNAREIDQALKSLGEHRGSIGRRYNDLKANFKKFKQDASLFRTTMEDRSKQIRDAICNDEDWESKVIQITDGRVREYQAQWDALHSQRDRLLNEIDSLMNDSRNQTLPAFKRQLVEYLNPLQPAKDRELRGMNDPVIKAYVDNGNREHANRQSNCAIKRMRLKDRTEPDCIRGCTIIEIKPNNAREIASGGTQVEGYRRGLVSMFNNDPKTILDPSSKWHPLAPCVRTLGDGSKRLELEVYVEVYNFCPGDKTMFWSVKDPLSNWEPPDALE
ncbi:MAG TPA: hypothetical protein VK427_22255 [Kofleriaceae bacterium]|nr:hypothetical protein [Kofleriaceae bacterium]